MKLDLSDKKGVNHISFVKWTKMYVESGIEKLLKHGRIGFKKSIIPSNVLVKIGRKN